MSEDLSDAEVSSGLSLCDQHGHDWQYVLPLQVKHEAREVLTICHHCFEENWMKVLPEDLKWILETYGGKK